MGSSWQAYEYVDVVDQNLILKQFASFQWLSRIRYYMKFSSSKDDILHTISSYEHVPDLFYLGGPNFGCGKLTVHISTPQFATYRVLCRNGSQLF